MARAAELRSRRGRRSVAGPAYRIVSSRFPTVTLFDSARSEAELEMLAELEGLTNPRLREALGELRCVPPGEAVYGPGCTPIMAAFCHPAPSRFTDGSFGVYYAGLSVQTALLETRHHRERFLRAAQLGPEVLEMRCYAGRLLQPMTLLPADAAQRAALLDPDDYTAARGFGAACRAAGDWGLFYPSVRDAPAGRCVAVLRPRALAPVQQEGHYRYYWDGARIGRIERYAQVELPASDPAASAEAAT